MFTSLPINYLSILAAAIAAFAIGGLWYSPFLFGNLWAKEQGLSPEKIKEAGASIYNAMIVSFLGYLVTGYVMSLLFTYLPITDASSALYWGFLLWLGFPAAIGLMNALYSHKSLVAYFIDTGYQLVYIEALALILALWK